MLPAPILASGPARAPAMATSAAWEFVPAHSLETLLDRVARAGAGETVSIADIRATIGERSFGPLLAVLGLFAASPLGVIPGVPTVMAATMGVAAGQLLVGRESIWLPRVLLRRTVKRAHLAAAVDKMRPMTRHIDRLLQPRLTGLTQGAAARAIALVCVLLCLLIPPMELLPFMATGPSAAIAAFGLAIFLQDGLLALAALALSGVSALLIVGVAL